jgi:hypothetical protein
MLSKADERISHKGWMQAKIMTVHEDMLWLQFINASDFYDTHVDRYAVEIAPFESKTKDDYAWRDTIETWTQLDAHDKFSWGKATIMDVKEAKIGEDRTFKVANVGYRIYKEDTSAYARRDEHGTYEGYNSKNDEWIPVCCPRLAPWASKVRKGWEMDEEEVEEDNDDSVELPGFDKVYAIPRVWKATSQLYTNSMNLFGSLGGFDECLDVL